MLTIYAKGDSTKGISHGENAEKAIAIQWGISVCGYNKTMP